MAQQRLVDQGLLTIETSPLHSVGPSGRGIGTTQRPVPDNTHNRQTDMTPAGFETAIPGSERPQIHALDHAARDRLMHNYVKSKAFPLQTWSGPEGSRKLRFSDFMTTAQDGGKVVSLTHRPPLPPEILLVVISVRG